MTEPSSFTAEIRGIASELRGGGQTHTALNRASSAIDHLGRRLHGLGYVRGREIADCFTAALSELGAAHGGEEEKRRDAVGRAVDQLDAALNHAAGAAAVCIAPGGRGHHGRSAEAPGSPFDGS
jgi:hypothetical protein